jgi:hypothetical protein
MKRRLFNLAAAISMLLSLAAAAAWAMSYARPADWHLLGIAHSADLTRVSRDHRTAVSMAQGQGSNVQHGFWDALWARSQSGTLTVVAQTVDYERNLRGVYASPPSLVVELPEPARARVVAFERMPDSRTVVRRLGFAWDTDAQRTPDGRVSARSRMITMPWWSIALLGLPLSLLWLREERRRRGSRSL